LSKWIAQPCAVLRRDNNHIATVALRQLLDIAREGAPAKTRTTAPPISARRAAEIGANGFASSLPA